MKKITIYTDGACSGNPGKGGWGAVLLYGEHQKDLSGYAAHTTNNQMELTAVIESLKTLKEKCTVALYTDSTYVKDGMTKWIFNWEKNNWRTANKKPVKNKELWQALQEQVNRHDIEWHWVKGHSGDQWNEHVDNLATGEIEKHRSL
ncbi:MAG: ribonuclease HI [Alphaproteobacteria bacterium]|nr:ribonuclease HI [Alphaproteobacteria bacterium]MBN2779925.1 ribonuclease HI [Alphaproteobacteria bacterium]